MKKPVKKTEEYTVNLATIDGDGCFPCPKCGLAISPDDETEENYTIVDTKVVNNELAELLVSCGKCSSIIKLTGFQSIDA